MRCQRSAAEITADVNGEFPVGGVGGRGDRKSVTAEHNENAIQIIRIARGRRTVSPSQSARIVIVDRGITAPNYGVRADLGGNSCLAVEGGIPPMNPVGGSFRRQVCCPRQAVAGTR